MRHFPLSTCERNFLVRCLQENQRVDGRSCEAFRSLQIIAGDEQGSCLAYLGNTKVFAQVSAELSCPKPGRANEGTVFVNLEMSPMAAPNYEIGRLGEQGIEICRLLERLLKECSCLDTESLCVQSGKKAWHIRVDVHVLDNDGSVIDCASVAAVTALMHFRRPDVTVIGDRVVVHSPEEKETVPLNLYHQPIAVTFGFVKDGMGSIVDPTEREERVLEGTVILAMNSRRELCALHCSGALIVQKNEIMRCTAKALQRAIEVIDTIKAVMVEDAERRSLGSVPGFVDQIRTAALNGMKTIESLPVCCDVKPGTSAGETATVSDLSQPMEIRTKGQSVHLGGSNVGRLMNERQNDTEDEKTLEAISVALNDQLNSLRKKDLQRTNDSDVSKLLGEIEDDIIMLEPAKDIPELRPESPEVIGEIDLTTAIKSTKKKKNKK